MTCSDVWTMETRGGIQPLHAAHFNEASLDWQSERGQSDVVWGARTDHRFHAKLGQGQQRTSALTADAEHNT